MPIDGTYDLGPGPADQPGTQETRYPLSRCISCGCCLEACPQYTPTNNFVGAAVISQARLFNDHPTGAALKDERLEALMERRRRRRLRQGRQLRRSLPEGDPAARVDRRGPAAASPCTR